MVLSWVSKDVLHNSVTNAAKSGAGNKTFNVKWQQTLQLTNWVNFFSVEYTAQGQNNTFLLLRGKRK